MAGADRVPALAHALQPLGCGTQHGAPRLHQPQGHGLRLGAAHRRGVRRAVARPAPDAAHLPQWLGARPVLHARDLVASHAVPQPPRDAVAPTGILLGRRAGDGVRPAVDRRAGGRGAAHGSVGDAAAGPGLRAALPVLVRHDRLRGLRAPHPCEGVLARRQGGLGARPALRLDHGAPDLPLAHGRDGAPHHGAHRPPRGHERAALSPEVAQKKLEDMLPGRIVIQRFSWRWYFDTARRCKLYDFTRRCWTDFRGCATSEAAPLPPAVAA